jgi:8-oxo-dGTP pyrophosphatase MutT (NUDIX family)
VEEQGWTIPLHSLPRGFLRLLENPPDPPVDPRPSATLALIREGPEDLEVLLLKRSPDSGFIPGAWVFPGGTLDPADDDDSNLALVHGLNGVPAPPLPPLPYWIAAARETFEETGVLLHRGEAPEPEALVAARTKLLDGGAGLAEVLQDINRRLDAESMTYVGHWLTPECEPRRYETRFFVARVPPHARVSPHEKEMVDAVWISPSEALERNRSGAFRLVLPTLFTLAELQPFRTIDSALDHLRKQPVPRRLPIPERTDDGVLFRLSE